MDILIIVKKKQINLKGFVMNLVYSGYVDLPYDSIINLPVCTTIEQTIIECHNFINKILAPIEEKNFSWDDDENPSFICIEIFSKERELVGTIYYEQVPFIK